MNIFSIEPSAKQEGIYLIGDYATLASIYLTKGDIGKCYYYLSRAYELEKDKETAAVLRSKAASFGEKGEE